ASTWHLWSVDRVLRAQLHEKRVEDEARGCMEIHERRPMADGFHTHLDATAPDVERALADIETGSHRAPAVPAEATAGKGRPPKRSGPQLRLPLPASHKLCRSGHPPERNRFVVSETS